MFNISYTVLAAFAFGLLATLVLAAWFTPARWWRQLNALALGIVVVGTWGIASLVLWLLAPSAQHAMVAAAPATQGVAMLAPMSATGGVSYRVHEDLNLRDAKGTHARRIAIVPAGTLVTTTGPRDGDWWHVSARVGERTVEGWSSSLWLRRADEGRRYE